MSFCQPLNLTTVTLSTAYVSNKPPPADSELSCMYCGKAPKSSHITPILRSLHWLKINERIEYKLLSLTYKVLTTSQPDYLHNLIVQSSGRTRSSSVVTLAQPSVSFSLQTINRSFRYASPYLWNQLPSSFRQPHSVHCPPGSPHPAHITSSQSPCTFALTIYHSLDLSLQT